VQRAAGLAQREVERRRLERPVAEAQRHVPLRWLRPQLKRGEVVAEAGQRPFARDWQRGPGLVQRGAVLAEHRDILAEPVRASANEAHVRRDALELVGEDGVQAAILARPDDKRQPREPRPERLAVDRWTHGVHPPSLFHHASPRPGGRPAFVPTSSSPTAATTTTSTAASSASEASDRSSLAARPSTAPGLAASAGSSSAPSPGSTTTKRPLVRYDRRHEIHEAFLALACCLVCFRRLQPSF
jgi:hypothetical protein